MLTNASRRIVTLMGFAVVFSVIGEEIRAHSSQKPAVTQPAPGAISGPAKIILGGTVAAALLSFLAETGQTAEEYAVGLASLAAATSMLINGGPVWTALNRIFGSQPTSSTTGATRATGSTSVYNTSSL